MLLTLGGQPQHGFDQPLGLLSDCHRRIEHFLDVLLRVLERTGGRGELPVGSQERRAVEVALDYFRTSAPRHTADEEESLFPRLRQRAGQDERVREALAALAALEADHDAADAAHAEVDFWFRRWLDIGPLAPPQARKLSETLTALRETYRRHIAIEDKELFPLAGQVLEADALANVGKEMAGRRGLRAKS